MPLRKPDPEQPFELGSERGATMVETALIGAILVVGLAGAILYMQQSTESRIDTGRSTFGCAELCEPGVSKCICSDVSGECSCQ